MKSFKPMAYLLIFLSGCKAGPVIERIPVDLASLLKDEKNIDRNFPDSSNLLAFDLYKKLSTKDGNLVFSPLSISAGLAMAYAGAKGETEDAFKQSLHFGDNSLPFHKSFADFTLLLAHKRRDKFQTQLELSNNLWLEQSFLVLDSFKDLLKSAYKALPIMLDIKNDPAYSTSFINQHIAKETKGEVPDLLKSQLPSDTALVLTNVLYFKSKWLAYFEREDTRFGPFTLLSGAKKDVRFMRQTTKLSYGEDEQKQFLLMPYRDPDLAALFILPALGKFAEVEKGLSDESFRAMLKDLYEPKVSLWLPKFSEKTSPDIKNALTDLGLGVAFDKEKANFKGISDQAKYLYISDIAHEAVVKMYEEGATATAATAVVFSGEMMAAPRPREKEVEFHADRPFLFYIFHRATNTILFMGKIVDPRE